MSHGAICMIFFYNTHLPITKVVSLGAILSPMYCNTLGWDILEPFLLSTQRIQQWQRDIWWDKGGHKIQNGL